MSKNCEMSQEELADIKAKSRNLIDNALDKDDEIICAISYFCQKAFISDPGLLRCRIKLTNDFEADYRRIHFKPDNAYPNGTTIPPIFQSSTFRQSCLRSDGSEENTVLLINNRKLGDNSRNLISVIVHELSHSADYIFKLPRVKAQYGLDLLQTIPGTVGNAIGGYYSAYSEIMAKYYQEMYLIESHDSNDYYDVFYKTGKDESVDSFREWELFNIDEIETIDDFYHAQHCAGKIRCWEEAFIRNPIIANSSKEQQIIKKIKDYYLHESQNREIITDMYEVWDWNVMLDKCDRLFKNNDENLLVRI